MIRLNDQLIDITIFPDKTSQMWKIPFSNFMLNTPKVHVVWRFESESEFMHLAQLKTLLDSRRTKATLELEYLPYARQDKEISNETTFALHTFANLLNTLKFDRVIIHDPHSKIALELIHNSEAVYPTSYVKEIMEETKSDIVVYPDNGATEKYSVIYPYSYVFGEKLRDQGTGRITSYKLVGDVKGKRVLIVDDICDGGATFILLSKALYDTGAIEVNLFVTHGIFSKGLQVLKDSGIRRIFTKDGEVK